MEIEGMEEETEVEMEGGTEVEIEVEKVEEGGIEEEIGEMVAIEEGMVGMVEVIAISSTAKVNSRETVSGSVEVILSSPTISF